MDSTSTGCIIALLAIPVVIVAQIVNGREKRRARRELYEHFGNVLQEKGFLIDNKAIFEDIALYVDDQLHCIAIKTNDSSNPIFVSYNELINVEFVDNGDGGSHGSIGGAIAGGVLFGGIGALVGLSMGSSGKCTLMQVRMQVNNVTQPEIILNFITSEIARSDEKYKQAFLAAKDFCGLLTYAINNRNISNATNNIG